MPGRGQQFCQLPGAQDVLRTDFKGMMKRSLVYGDIPALEFLSLWFMEAFVIVLSLPVHTRLAACNL